MLKISIEDLNELENRYPGITANVMKFENALLPGCSYCMSKDTAIVQVGIIGRTINIAACTTKFKLIPNSPKPGKYFCNSCKKFFDDEEDPGIGKKIKHDPKIKENYPGKVFVRPDENIPDDLGKNAMLNALMQWVAEEHERAENYELAKKFRDFRKH